MNFLQYAIWGAWLISLGTYLFGSLHFEGVQIGSFFAIMGITSLFMPGVMGIIADRWVPAQILLGVCHILGAVFLILAATQTTYATLYPVMFLAVLFYMPTIALSNSVAFNALEKHGFDTVKDFPPIRVFGTVGFICSMLIVDFAGFSTNHNQLYLSAAISFMLGVYAMTLPHCPVTKVDGKKSFIDAMGLRAFSLFKEKKMALFFIFSMLLGAALQVTNAFANPYITSFAEIPQYADTFGVKHANALISLSQISETLCILLIPFFLKKFGIKKVMLISMFAWVLRFGLFGVGNPGTGVWMFILSMIVYGVAFDFFNISGSLFVNKETNPSIRSSAQGLFMIMTNGFGATFGSYAAGFVVDKFVYKSPDPSWSTAWFIFAGYALVVAIVFGLVFKYKYKPENIK
jgi:NHS family xanthosine MFS transporter